MWSKSPFQTYLGQQCSQVFFKPGSSKCGLRGNTIEDLVAHLPLVALVLAAEGIDLGAEPEEGEVGEVGERAAALDALADAEKRSREAEKEAAKVVEDPEVETKKSKDEK